MSFPELDESEAGILCRRFLEKHVDMAEVVFMEPPGDSNVRDILVQVADVDHEVAAVGLGGVKASV